MTTALARPEGTDRTDRWLTATATLFTVAVLIHNMDHLRRGTDSIGRDVFALGSSGIILEVGLVVLICQRHRLAALASATIGSGLAAGYVFVHFLPHRSWLSDSFVSAEHVSPLSWGAASLEVAAALILGATGSAALIERGGLASATRPHPSQRPIGAVATNPLVVVMAIGNLVILIASLAQL